MADMKLQADITAVDRASPVFAKVASGAEKMGTSVATASQKASKSTGDLSKNLAALGAAFTAGAAILGEWSRNSQDAAAIQRQLEASIVATGASYADYAARIAEVSARAIQLGQDDEAAAQAIAALTQITGSANVALEQMGLVFDIAAAKHLTLENAAELVGKVLTGNTAILARYGIVVKEGSDATSALAQISQQVSGQAEANATGYARIREEISNLTDSIGGAVGQFAPFLSLLPGLSSGLALAGAAAGALTGLMGTQAVAAQGAAAAELELAAATEVAAGAAVTAEAASAGLLAVLGPIGLVAAAAAAAFAIYKLTQGHHDEADAAKDAQQASADLAATLHDLVAAGGPLSTTATAWANALAEGLGQIPAQVQAIRDQMTALSGTDQPVAIDPNATDEATVKLRELEAQLEALQIATDDQAEAQVALGNIFRDTGVGADLAQQAAADLFAAFANDQDIVKLTEGLIRIGTHLGDFDITANEAVAAAQALALASTGAADGMEVLDKAVGDLTLGLAETAKGQKLLADIQLIATEGTDEQRASIQKLWEQVEAGTAAFGTFSSTVALNANIIRDHERAINDLSVAFDRATDRQQAYQEGLSKSIADAQAQRERDTARYYETEGRQQEDQQTRLSEASAAGYAKRDKDSQRYFEREAQRQEQYQQGISDQIAAAADAAAKQAEINARIIDIEIPDKVGTALERIARGSRDAADALQGFKDVQDGIISQQDVFNSQFSEYGSQISNIERAQQILNDRQAEGQKLQDDQLAFLNEAPAALERLTGGQEDAAIAAGELAVQYGENMSVGDKLNENLGNLDGTVSGLADSINALTAALGGVPPKTDAEVSVAGLADNIHDAEYMSGLLDFLDAQSANPDVSVAGLGDALSGVLALQGAIAGLDGMSAVTNVRNVVTNETNNIVNGANFRDGGIVPHAFARDGLTTHDYMSVTVGEAGRETVLLPGGAYIRNAAATAAMGGGRGLHLTVNVGEVNGFAGVNEFVDSLTHALRARWSSLGM